MATSTQLSLHLSILPPKEGSSQKTLLNTNAQFGLATLWRRAKHKFTPKLVRQVLTSSRFQNRLELWTIVHALGSNTKARFEQTKMLRSNDGGLILCYALRLANNTQEPFRTLSLTAIDASIKWWHGKPAPRASALRAPWSLSPNLQSQLRKFLRQWHLQMLDHQVPCHTPSFKTVFIKHAAVLDILCNHKQAIEDWSTSNPALCCCKSWSCYKSAALNPSDPHWVLSGSLLHSLLPPELAVIAEGSLSNKLVFPSKKEYHNQMRLGFKTWTKKNGLPSMPQANISDFCHHLWSEHTQQITNHITKSSINQLQSTFDGAIFHCEDKHASSLRIYCPCLYYQSIESTFQDPSIFEQLPDEPSSIVSSLVESLHRQHGKAYPWAVGSGRQLPQGYILAKRKKEFRSGRPIISFVESPFRPMLNILARLIFQLIPAACPNHFATGDVYTLLSILREAPVDADLILVNQDLAGFFTSTDQDSRVTVISNTNKQTNTQTHKHKQKQTKTKTNKQANKQTKKERKKETNKQTSARVKLIQSKQNLQLETSMRNPSPSFHTTRDILSIQLETQPTGAWKESLQPFRATHVAELAKFALPALLGGSCLGFPSHCPPLSLRHTLQLGYVPCNPQL